MLGEEAFGRSSRLNEVVKVGPEFSGSGILTERGRERSVPCPAQVERKGRVKMQQ